MMNSPAFNRSSTCNQLEKLMKLTKALQADPVRALIMGLPGSGKSTLAAKLASEGINLKWIDLENSLSVLQKMDAAAMERVEVLALKDSASYPVAAETLMVLFKEGKVHACNQHSKHNCPLCKPLGADAFTDIDFSTLTANDCVVLDSSSQLSASLLANITKGKAVDSKPERDDWGSLRKYTEFFTSQFQACPVNLIVIAHAMEAEMEDKKIKLVPTFGSAGASANFAKAFNDVIYTEVKNKKHVAYSSSVATMNIITKSRSDFDIEKLPVASLLPLFKRAA
jgi:AAA domain